MNTRQQIQIEHIPDWRPASGPGESPEDQRPGTGSSHPQYSRVWTDRSHHCAEGR